MDTGQHDLFCAAVERRLNIENYICKWTTARFAARNSGDAERAMVVASILHLDESARTVMQPRQWLAGKRFEVKGFKLKVKNIGNKMMFSFIGDNLQNMRQVSCLRWLQRGPTSRGDNIVHSS